MKTRSFESVAVGDALPELPIPITVTLVVGGALASRDYTPVHHDKAAAQAQGMSDVFMNILTTNGLVGRYVTDWAGPDAIVRNVAIKLGAPNVPGDTMKMVGTVKSKDDAKGEVVLDVTGKNGWGNHVNGTVRVALPRSRCWRVRSTTPPRSSASARPSSRSSRGARSCSSPPRRSAPRSPTPASIRPRWTA